MTPEGSHVGLPGRSIDLRQAFPSSKVLGDPLSGWQVRKQGTEQEKAEVIGYLTQRVAEG
jgi:hypothetical protein